MKTIHLHAGTGLRVERCLSSNLFGEYRQMKFPIENIGWGMRDPDPKSDFVRLIFDTRYIDNLANGKERVVRLGDELRAVIHPVAPPVGAALIVDLGNTRSFGLLLDDMGHANAMQIHPLKIQDYSGWTSANTQVDVFASHVCLEQLAAFDHPAYPGELGRYGRPLSPLRTGAAAKALILQANSFAQQANSRISLVSPKRFFWDNDRVRFKWRAVSADDKACVEPQGVLYHAWLSESRIEAERMPPSSLIGAMVVELYSQAEMQINGEVAATGLAADGPRRIRHVAITYPPAWTKREKEAYREAIVQRMTTYCRERGLQPPHIHIECDEATGTLLAYVSNEVEKLGGGLAEWVALVGNRDEGGNSCARFAVLDVGGGTSDLIIADVAVSKGKFGYQQFDVRRFHQDGVLVAGDELLRVVATRVVLPALAEAICPDSQVARADLFNYAVSQPTTDDDLRRMRAHWAQNLWSPLALLIVKAWQDNERVEIPSDMNGFLNSFCQDCLQLLRATGRSRAPFKVLGTEDENPAIGDIAKLFNELKPQPQLIRDICAEVFADAGERFGIPIALAGCDRVLLAGKTTEFKPVREILTQSIPLPNHKIISFEGYRLAPRWVASAGKNGADTLGDVKMTTVMGAALEFCASKGFSVFGFASKPEVKDAYHFSEAQQYWGIVPQNAVIPVFSNEDAVFTPGSEAQREQIPLKTQSLLLARRRTKLGHVTAQIAYELRVKPKYAGIPDGLVELERVVDGDGTVDLRVSRVVSGTFEFTHGRQEKLTVEHIELRQMVAQNSDFWISEGNLHETIQW